MSGVLNDEVYRGLLREEILREVLNFEKGLVERTRKAVVGIAAGGGYGSGSHIGEGYILTNCHVTGRSRRVQIEWPINKGREKLVSAGDVIFNRPDYDLSVVRDRDARNHNRPRLYIKPEEVVEQGTKVCVLGSPLTLFMTCTFGHITATHRELDYYGVERGSLMTSVFFQTDAAINPGNSGGACVDYEGDLIGVPSAGYDGADNIGFVIKINSIIEFIREAEKQKNLEIALLRAMVV